MFYIVNLKKSEHNNSAVLKLFFLESVLNKNDTVTKDENFVGENSISVIMKMVTFELLQCNNSIYLL